MEVVKPTLLDVDELYNLIDYFAKKGDILKRSKENIAERIREFVCIKEDNSIVAASSLRLYYPFLAEVRTIVVRENYQNRHLGSKLVEISLEEARSLGVKNVFALTFKKEFFLKLGFVEIDKKELPSKKVWEDCVNCPYFPSCKEEAVIISLT
ncbi:N-acetyltransferase [Hippea maritima]|uniref:GCN5-related N-acetyltransferase n=1 Tax=Hippea maritima (strain ATCC 700847 / DSM 10411 / MH2) TaxID=760142 RepID=F2LTS0_HIPMA|nr:N-acetyltransferase [Hippea maritima]AEA34446.1 GCN5-related N-acetyltransferase [Hippea maritima DSM 10411]